MSTNTASNTIPMNKKSWTPARVRNMVIDIIIWLVLTAVSLMCLLPFIHVLSKSISEEAYVVANKVVLLPKGFSLNAYQKIFADTSIMRSMFVTVVVTVTFTAIGMFLTICAAYVLSRKTLKGRKVMTFLIMLTMYFVAGTIPDYLLMSNLHMLDTWWCLILPLCFAPYNLLIMKNNFQSNISDSLIEAAVIDGASHFTILSKIVVPLSSRSSQRLHCFTQSDAGMPIRMPCITLNRIRAFDRQRGKTVRWLQPYRNGFIRAAV